MCYTPGMRRLVLAIAFVLGLGAMHAAAAEPPQTHEIIYTRPSGFWTSNRPAVGGSYRWRLLGVGAAVLGITGFFMLRIVRKANAAREQS